MNRTFYMVTPSKSIGGTFVTPLFQGDRRGARLVPKSVIPLSAGGQRVAAIKQIAGAGTVYVVSVTPEGNVIYEHIPVRNPIAEYLS